MAKTNREYKDSVFSLYFSDKERLIELINAIEGTNYPKDTEIEINTIEDALYKGRKNDISFIINGVLVVLVEHQSTLNENMPLRIFIYIARIYEQIAKLRKIYGSTLVKIPTPRFIVLYNGERNCADYRQLKLSDAFAEQKENPALELKVDLYNINYGRSGIIKKSRSLEEYSTFIHYVRQEQREKGKALDDAISAAIDRAIQDNIMKKFLEKYGSEVQNMLFEEWDWEQYAAVQREEGHREGWEKGQKKGREEGRREGAVEMLSNMIRKMAKSSKPEEIADTLELPLSQVESILNPS